MLTERGSRPGRNLGRGTAAVVVVVLLLRWRVAMSRWVAMRSPLCSDGSLATCRTTAAGCAAARGFAGHSCTGKFAFSTCCLAASASGHTFPHPDRSGPSAKRDPQHGQNKNQEWSPHDEPRAHSLGARSRPKRNEVVGGDREGEPRTSGASRSTEASQGPLASNRPPT